MGVEKLTSTRLSAVVLEFSQENERVASMLLRVTGGKALTVVCVETQNGSSQYQTLLESLGGLLKYHLGTL